MQDFESIQLVDYLMHNPAVQAGEGNPAIASMMQKFPFFVPLRYINASAVCKKEGITLELLNDIYSYQGNPINFQKFLLGEEINVVKSQNEELTEISENAPQAEIVAEELPIEIQEDEQLDAIDESVDTVEEEVVVAEVAEEVMEEPLLAETPAEAVVEDAIEDLIDEPVVDELPATPKVHHHADTLAFLRGEENSDIPKYDLNDLLEDEPQVEETENTEVLADSGEIPVEEPVIKPEVTLDENVAAVEIEQDVENEMIDAVEARDEKVVIEAPIEEEIKEEQPVVELHEELTEEEFLKILEGKDAPEETEIETPAAPQVTNRFKNDDVLSDIPVMPYSAVDYFEQQGISVEKEANTIIENEIQEQKNGKNIDVRDKSLMVMMKFSEWLLHFKKTANDKQSEDEGQKALKAMWQREKLAATFEDDSEDIPDNVLEMAVNSITQEEGLASESLAEIYVKQQKFDKAIDMYKKLSLQFPEKNTYFASKIEEILKDNN